MSKEIIDWVLFRYVLWGSELRFAAPLGDATWRGTVSVISRDLFHYQDIKFEPNDLMIDVGANIGLVSLFFAKKYPFIRIVAIEPSELSCKLLKYNCVLNGVVNIDIVCAAAGVSDTFITGYVDQKNVSCLDMFMEESKRFYNVVNIKQIDFIEFLKNYSKIKFLKMDVEGAEYAIFEKLFEFPDVLKRIEYMHLETHENDTQGNSKELQEKVKEHFGDRVWFDV